MNSNPELSYWICSMTKFYARSYYCCVTSNHRFKSWLKILKLFAKYTFSDQSLMFGFQQLWLNLFCGQVGKNYLNLSYFNPPCIFLTDKGYLLQQIMLRNLLTFQLFTCCYCCFFIFCCSLFLSDDPSMIKRKILTQVIKPDMLLKKNIVRNDIMY